MIYVPVSKTDPIHDPDSALHNFANIFIFSVLNKKQIKAPGFPLNLHLPFVQEINKSIVALIELLIQTRTNKIYDGRGTMSSP